jgi:hypothetical protein
LNFVKNIGSTAWWAINKNYGVGNIAYKAAIDDTTYSQGKNLTLNSTMYIVYLAMTKGLLPKDTNSIYTVISSR